jgi:stage II sporulation protein D
MRGNARPFVALGFALAFAGCVQPSPHGPAAGLRLPERLRVRVANAIALVPLDEYVAASALSENTPVDESPEAAARILEVQAILARSYAVVNLGRHAAEGFDLCDTTHCQLYQPGRLTTSRFARAAVDATARTSGMVLAYGSRVAQTLFHADCGGHTAAAHEVWGGEPVPYLVSTSDRDAGAQHGTWELTIPLAQLRAALAADDRTRIDSALAGLEIRSRDEGGRALDIAILGRPVRIVRAEHIRAALNRVLPAPGLRSTRITVERAGSAYRIRGAGYGHGVGLCQAGAAARARRGDSLERVMAVYFPGTRLARIR